MARSHYNWQRFWIPRGSSVHLSGNGYLLGERRYLNPHLRTLAELMNIRCLVLLGEPGLGKSLTISAEYKKLASEIEQTGERFYTFNLSAYRSEELLVKRLFESEEFGEWINGSHHLHLFLDGLDECLLRIDTVAALLAEELRKCPIGRLLLRIACRSADWPPSLGNRLEELWGNEAVAFYELCLLREEDVALAAEVEGLNVDSFLAEVHRKEAVPFATKPITLDFLLRRYRKDGQLPNTQAALYEDGCRLLADESNQSYLDSRAPRQLTADQRMLVAGRIAAVTIFSNKAAIWLAVDRGEVHDEDATIRGLSGYTECINGHSFAVTEAAIKETIGTALFSLRDENRLGWAHQTYAEFLAAWYLKHHQFEPVDVMRLLTLPQDASKKIVPQLYETAARLAGMMPDVFRQIMKNDPNVLLRGDLAAVSPTDREALVAALLEAFRAEQARDDWFDRDHYRKLKHPELAEQLRQIISSRDENFLVRRVAIDIAEACELREVQSELATLAFDQSDLLPTRIQAACAVSKIGDKETRAKLKPLVFGQAGDDPNNELLGYGLKALWPELFTAEEVFASLIEPRESFLGAYYAFLHHDFMAHLKPADLPAALNWVASQRQGFQEMSSLRRLGDEILIKAWDHLDSPEILAGFARAAFIRLKTHHEMIDVDWRHGHANPFDDDDKRCRVLRAMMSWIEDAENDWHWLVCSPLLSIKRQDALWLLEVLLSEQSEIVQVVVSRLLARFFNHSEVEPECLSAISDACHRNAILAANFTFCVELESPQAQQMRSNYEILRKYEERKKDHQSPQPPSESSLLPLLEQFEQGDLTAWWQLNFKLAVGGGNEHESDLTALPGWQSVDEETCKRIVAAAKKYLVNADPETSEWLGTNVLYRPAFAGYRAFRLLLTSDPAFVTSLGADVWRTWVPMIVTYPLFSSDIEKAGHSHRLLTNLAYRNSPETVVDTLLFQIDKRNDGNDIWLSFDRLEDCWDDQLLSAVLEKAKDERIKPDLFRQLLQQLLGAEYAEAGAFAKSLLKSPLSAEGQIRERASIAAQELLLNAQDAAWEVVWPMFQQDIEFGRDVVEAIVDRPSESSVVTRLNEWAAAELYIWLCQQYPHSRDPQESYGFAYTVTTRHSLAHWRDAIPNYLMERGTTTACAALERIVRALPHLEWLKFVLLDAQKNTRRREWSPLRPEALIAITAGGLKLSLEEFGIEAISRNEGTKQKMAEQNSTIDDLDKLKAGLTQAQYDIINEIWRYYCERQKWMPVIALYQQFGPEVIEREVESFGGGVVYEFDDSGIMRFQLSLLGIFLTDEGEELENLLFRVMEYIWQYVIRHPETSQINGQEVEAALGVDEKYSQTLAKVLLPSGFMSAGGGYSGGRWDMGVPREIGALRSAEDVKRYVRERAIESYRKRIPMKAKERMQYFSMSQTQEWATSREEIDIFISHSSSDAKIAEALIDLIRDALNVPNDKIRCTSVDGYRLGVGASFEEQLRQEVHEAKVLIGLITPNSMKSAYVLFELGARWGAGKQLAPVLAAGADSRIMRGPLSSLNALNLTSESETMQLVENLATKIGKRLNSASSYQRRVKALVEIARPNEQL